MIGGRLVTGARTHDRRAWATIRAGALLFVLLPLAACEFGQVCTTRIEFGITVTIVDSVSGEPRAAEAVAVARDGEYVDTLSPSRFQGGVLISRQGVPERPGFYEVSVQAPGYLDWVQEGVMVRPGDCHVRRVELEARLQSP